MRGAVRFQRPNFHFSETLTAELRLSAEGLLRNEGIRSDGTRVNFIVDQVNELDHVHDTDGNAVFKRFARSAVEYLEFAVHFAVGVEQVVLLEQLFNVLLRRAVEYGRGDFPAELAAHVAEVNFQHLPDVHTGRHAERVEQNLQGSAVGQERHVALRKHTGNDALVSVAARHLVADLNFTLLRDVHAHQLVDAGGELVLILAREDLHVYDDAALSVGNTEGSVAHLSRLFAEDGAEQALFGRELRFALGRNFTDEDIAAAHFRADAHDAVLVQIFERVVAHVGNVARDFFFAELGVARFRLVLLDMNGGEHVVLHELFGNKNRVLVVIAFPLHESDENVFSERKLAVVGGRSVGDDLVLFHPVARGDDGALIEAGALVGTLEFFERIFRFEAAVLFDSDHVGGNGGRNARFLRADDDARIARDRRLDARRDDGRLRFQKRHRLALHVRAHEGAVGIVVFKERNERRRDGNELLGADVHVVDALAGELGNDFFMAAADALVDETPLFVQRFVRLRDDVAVLFVRREVIDVVGYDARLLVYLTIGRHDEAELVDLGEGRKRGDKTDVLTFGGLDRAHAPVVRVVNVADFKGRAVAVQAAGTERGEFSLMREFRDGVGLIHELRELRRTEEFADDRRNRAHVDEPGRRNFHGILRRHALLDKALQPRHTDAELILKEFSHRAHAAVAEVVDLVDGADAVFQIEVGGNGGDDVIHRDALVVELFDEWFNFLLLGGRYAHHARFRFEIDGRAAHFLLLARENLVEELARLYELDAVFLSALAVLLFFLLLVRFGRGLPRVIHGVDFIEVFFRNLFRGERFALLGEFFRKYEIGIINGFQQPERLGVFVRKRRKIDGVVCNDLVADLPVLGIVDEDEHLVDARVLNFARGFFGNHFALYRHNFTRFGVDDIVRRAAAGQAVGKI